MVNNMNMKQIFITLLIITIYAVDLSAQSKPKRDVSKDKSVLLAKKKEAQKVAEKAAQKKREAKKYRKKRVIQTPKTASFLRVNQLHYIKKRLSSNGGSETFEVNTDGKEWNVVALPIWCRLTKYTNSFVLSYNQNPSHDERSDWFKVQSDNLEVKIDIIQTGLPLNINANFNYCSLQHDAIRYNNKGMSEKCLTIHSNVTIRGAKKQKCLIVAFFSDDAGNSIKATYKYPDYAISSSKDVFVATEVVPTSDEAQTFNTVLYLPNDAMALLKKKSKVRCQLAVYCVKTSSYISNANYTMYFKAKKKRGKITTKKL